MEEISWTKKKELHKSSQILNKVWQHNKDKYLLTHVTCNNISPKKYYLETWHFDTGKMQQPFGGDIHHFLLIYAKGLKKISQSRRIAVRQTNIMILVASMSPSLTFSFSPFSCINEKFPGPDNLYESQQFNSEDRKLSQCHCLETKSTTKIMRKN